MLRTMAIVWWPVVPLWAWWWLASTTVDAGDPQAQAARLNRLNSFGPCQPVSVDLCYGFQYNMTMYPNLLNHLSQDEALVEVTQFVPLIRTRCNVHLRFFLCVVYVPICVALDYPVPPCRDLCSAVRRDCESVVNRCGFAWPAALQCELFPIDGLCIGLNNSASADPHHRRSVPPPQAADRLLIDQLLTSSERPAAQRLPSVQDRLPWGNGRRLFHCPRRLRSTNNGTVTLTDGDRDDDGLLIADELVPSCQLPCNFLLSSYERHVLRWWIGAWSVLGVLSSLFTLATYLINRQRFFYPERTMIFLSLCCCAVSLVYLVGALFAGDGDSTSCRTLTTVQLDAAGIGVHWLYDQTSYPVRVVVGEGPAPLLGQGQGQGHGHGQSSTTTDGRLAAAIDVVRRGALSSVRCTLLALTGYFFTVAGHVWWVILNVTWFMSAGLKWSHEAIEARGAQLHVFAWTVPAIMTTVVAAMDVVDGDVFSGVCSVGNVDPSALRRLVVTPLMVSFLVGIVFLAAGIRSLFKIRRYMRGNAAERNRLEQLMIRISVFSILYAVPALVLCICHMWFAAQLPSWLMIWYDAQCRNRLTKLLYGFPARCPPLPDLDEIRPQFLMFMMKYLTILVIGLTASFWTWSSKTVADWSRFCVAVRRRLQRAARRSSDLLIP